MTLHRRGNLLLKELFRRKNITKIDVVLTTDNIFVLVCFSTKNVSTNNLFTTSSDQRRWKLHDAAGAGTAE